MGYTHYWTFNKPAHTAGAAAAAELSYNRAILDCQRVIRAWQREHVKGGITDDHRLSGYSAHCSIGSYGGIQLNGKGDKAHEDFMLREHYAQNLGQRPYGVLDDSSSFCKTARKPYDTVVVACLAILKHRLGDLVSVESDGDSEDWQLGVELARRVTKLKINNPIKLTKLYVA